MGKLKGKRDLKMRKKVKMPQMFSNWAEVDMGLAQIAQAQREIEKIEHEMQEEVERAKKEAAKRAEKHESIIKDIELGLALFADENKQEFDEKKTKELNFGFMGFRKSTRLMLPKGEDKLADIILKLKAKGMSDCVIQKAEKIDKDALKAYSEEEIRAVGAWLDVSDKFWYEAKREEVKK